MAEPISSGAPGTDLPLAGRIAFVTGAAGRGTGRATAYALARDGADVAVNAEHSLKEAEEVAADLRALGRRSIVAPGNIADPAAVAAAMARVRDELGAPDILAVTAGARWRPRRIDDIPPDDWRAVLGEEIDAAYLLVREVLPAMRAAERGSIIVVGGFGADDWTVPPEDGPIDYALGKAARHWLVRTLALQEAPHGVTVNGVAPGPITRVPLDRLPDAVLGRHDLAAYRRPTQVDVANAIAWLAGAPAVTGSLVQLPGPEPGAVRA